MNRLNAGEDMLMGIEPIRLQPTRCPLPCKGGDIRARRPHDRRRGLLAGRAALAFLIERATQAADDEAAHRGRIAETNLGLGRMDIDVDLVEWNIEEQRRDRVPVA